MKKTKYNKMHILYNIYLNINYLIFYKNISTKKVIKETWFTEEEFSYLENLDLKEINKKIDEDLLFKLSEVLDVDMKLFFINSSLFSIVEILDYYFENYNNKIEFKKLIVLLFLIQNEYNKEKIPFISLNFQKWYWELLFLDIFEIKDLLEFENDWLTICWTKTKNREYLIFPNNKKWFELIDKIFKEFWNKSLEELNKIIMELFKKEKENI